MDLINGLLVLVTIGLVVVGCLQWRTYQATLDANKVVQRAYVDISHFAPGLIFTKNPSAATVTVKVKNYGKTPATVTDVFLTLRISRDPLPDSVPYGQEKERQPTASFLVAGGSFSKWWWVRVSEDDSKSIDEGVAEVWLLGYVDYEDVFGQKHRGGYARRYDRSRGGLEIPPKNRNNLVFETKPGYNYDSDTIDPRGPKGKQEEG